MNVRPLMMVAAGALAQEKLNCTSVGENGAVGVNATRYV